MRYFEIDEFHANEIYLRHFVKSDGRERARETRNAYSLKLNDIPGLIKVLQDFMEERGEDEDSSIDPPDSLKDIEMRVAAIERIFDVQYFLDEEARAQEKEPKLVEKPGTGTTKGSA